MRRLLCIVLGHRWGKVREICHWAITMGHLHPLAGCEATCLRCGRQWRDSCGGTAPLWSGCQP